MPRRSSVLRRLCRAGDCGMFCMPANAFLTRSGRHVVLSVVVDLTRGGTGILRRIHDGIVVLGDQER
jgi:hypothetical protein